MLRPPHLDAVSNAVHVDETVRRHRPSWPRVLAGNGMIWLCVITLHTVATYSDQVRRTGHGEFPELFRANLLAYLPWVFFSAGLYVVFARNTHRMSSLRFIGGTFVLAGIFYFVPQEGYLVWLAKLSRPSGTFWVMWAQWPLLYWFIDFGILITTFAVVYTIVSVRESYHAEQRKQRLNAENLQLRLELEQQRLQALRAQLEPHFLFNALNAISSLVRSNDKGVAISALQQLSSLLRYALTASSREWVTMHDEIQFVREYLALQHVRYGDRLSVTIEGDSPIVTAGDCLPLLLQPLVENAIRHDVERHDGPSDIRIALTLDDAAVEILVSNSVHPNASPNPGLGLGLRATADRLAYAYHGKATLNTTVNSGRFVVSIRMPRYPDD